MKAQGAEPRSGGEGLQEAQREVLEFWFGPELGVVPTPPGSEVPTPLRSEVRTPPRSEWFVKDADFDAAIVRRFGPLIEAALAGDCDAWPRAPLPALAYIIVLDQFTRNAFRDTPRAFAGDARALAAARAAVDAGWDLQLSPLQRWFCYMPFEHSESLADQQQSLRLFGALRDDPQAGGAWTWAEQHHAVIERFGRFPHRNAILGRASSAEELAFLAQPGSRF